MPYGNNKTTKMSEIVLQYLEHNTIYDILTSNHILGYFRYVDDILIIYNKTITNIHTVHDEFNRINKDIQFTIEDGANDSINFLDITIQKTDKSITINIYRKPTFTDSIIPNDSCHPQEHKHAAIRRMTNRIQLYGLNHINREKEKNTIQHTVHNNKFDISLIHTFTHTQPKKEEQIIGNKKWAKFTYVGRETRHITKLFKESTIRPSFTTNNTIMKVLNIKTEQRKNQYDNSGIYQLTCPDCHKKYIGQTGR
jgi:tRNA/tmRNA/rRNA uracil-C5-methylase (TrmA/RlmC/RlmD family)